MFHAHHHLYAWRWWKPRGSERAWGLLEPELQAPMICSAISVLGTEPRSCARAAVIALQPLSALSMYKTLNLVSFYLFLMDVFSLRFVGFCFFSPKVLTVSAWCLVFIVCSRLSVCIFICISPFLAIALERLLWWLGAIGRAFTTCALLLGVLFLWGLQVTKVRVLLSFCGRHASAHCFMVVSRIITKSLRLYHQKGWDGV